MSQSFHSKRDIGSCFIQMWVKMDWQGINIWTLSNKPPKYFVKKHTFCCGNVKMYPIWRNLAHALLRYTFYKWLLNLKDFPFFFFYCALRSLVLCTYFHGFYSRDEVGCFGSFMFLLWNQLRVSLAVCFRLLSSLCFIFGSLSRISCSISLLIHPVLTRSLPPSYAVRGTFSLRFLE